MEPILERIWTPMVDLVVRSDGRTVYGLCVPWDTEARVNDGQGPYTEVFRRGSFAKTIAERGARIKLNINHDKKRAPIGKAINLREDGAGVVGEFYVSKTREGDEALELARDGVLDAFSVGFAAIPGKSRKERDLVERFEVKLDHVALTGYPAYVGAAIAGVRSDICTPDVEAAIGTSDEEAAARDDEPVVTTTRTTPKHQREHRARLVLEKMR